MKFYKFVFISSIILFVFNSYAGSKSVARCGGNTTYNDGYQFNCNLDLVIEYNVIEENCAVSIAGHPNNTINIDDIAIKDGFHFSEPQVVTLKLQNCGHHVVKSTKLNFKTVLNSTDISSTGQPIKIRSHYKNSQDNSNAPIVHLYKNKNDVWNKGEQIELAINQYINDTACDTSNPLIVCPTTTNPSYTMLSSYDVDGFFYNISTTNNTVEGTSAATINFNLETL